MSYILDALRRADAERTRGAVPGLHAQNIPGDNEPAARNYTPLAWAAGGAGALLLAVVAVLVFGPWHGASTGPAPLASASPLNAGPLPGDPPVTTAQGETPAARPGGMAPAAMPVEPPISHGNTTAGADSRLTLSPTQNLPAQNLPAQTLPAQTLPGTVPPRFAERAAEGRVATLEPRGAANVPGGRVAATGGTPDPGAAAVEHYGAPPVAAPAPVPAPLPAAKAAVPNINDLPPATRAELPRLAVGGAIYSASPADRMVILNGQVFHEGDKPAADTVLEQIRLKSAVLNYRGQRYEITF